MCGIVGELQFRSVAAVDAARTDAHPGEAHTPRPYFARLIDLMARRGPDDAGYWADEVCQLGFRRLAILDLSPAANQPMCDESGRYVLLFNGELYNFRQLRVELERAGQTFHTTGDTEVVLKALIQWGRAALERFNGMFALGFYDARRRALLLARDHVGIKPLYTLLTDDGLLFASQYDQLLAHPWSVSLPVDAAALGLYLRLGYVPAPYAILERTAMLEPGCWLEASADSGVSRGRYYAFPVYQEADLRGETAFEAIDAAVGEAVRRQLVSDVPLGVFLSGGIDSPLVAAKARAATSVGPAGANGSGSLKAFTIGAEGADLDETPEATQYARALGLEHVVEHYTPAKALEWLDRVIEACGEPMADDSIFPTMLVTALARQQVTVMLSGDGGDELLWGYVERFGMVLREAEAFRRPPWWRSGQYAAARLAGGSPGWLRRPTIGDWYRAVHSRLSDEGLARVFGVALPWPEGFDLFTYGGWRQDETAQWLRWSELNGHLTRVLLKVDRASMYHSLEVRVPLLDREVIDVAARVDWRSCLDLNGLGKRPLRQALLRQIGFQSTVKRGFGAPMAAWLRGPLLPLFRERVLDRADLLGLPVNRLALAGLLEAHTSGRADYGRWLWAVLSLALWSDRYLKR